MNKVLQPNWPTLLLGILGLGTVYVLKDNLNPWTWLQGYHEVWRDGTDNMSTFPVGMVVLNKTLRYVLNDLFSILIIHGLFQNRQYTRFAFGVLLFGLIVLLPTYYVLVYNTPEGHNSMVSNIHRIVLNPVLMMLLIPYFYFLERQKLEK